MNIICIQAELGLDARFSESLLSSSLVDSGFVYDLKIDGKELNYYIDVENVTVAWIKIKNEIITIQEIGNSCDVICPGSLGWDNFEFLHHSKLG